MKRYVVLKSDFDTRANLLDIEIKDSWEERVKQQRRTIKAQVLAELKLQLGEANFDRKLADFKELGEGPFSVIAYHNRFFAQSRYAFTVGAYYPAAAGTVSLGERVLNHLVLKLRDNFKSDPHYKRVYNKESFDNWDSAIDALESWKVLLPECAADFRKLRDVRNEVIHFDPALDANVRGKALEAIRLMSRIVAVQFGALPGRPWFIPGTQGQDFIKKEWESNPFIREVYLPNCAYVGPYFLLKATGSWPMFKVDKDPDLGIPDGTDEDFCKLFNERGPKMKELGLIK